MKIITAISKVFILLSALSILSVSLMAFADPRAVMQLVEVELYNNDAISSIRGVYGGVGLTLVTAMIYLMLKDLKKGLLFLSLLWGFYAVSRMITILVDGSLGEFGNKWLAIESVFFFLSAILWLLLKQQFRKESGRLKTAELG